MEDVLEFCERVMGAGIAASDAAREALAGAADDRVEVLAAASRACRSRPPVEAPRTVSSDTAAAAVRLVRSSPPSSPAPARRLADAVAGELAAATAELPERQREVLALRELARLSYPQIAAVLGIGETAVAPLLARARLGLREARRGTPARRLTECGERDRATRAIATRHDGEPLAEQERGWLIDHLGSCEACARAHAMMLEASLSYRSWQPRAARITDPLPEAGNDPLESESLLEPDEPFPAESMAVVTLRPAKLSWWQRLGAALAADARR